MSTLRVSASEGVEHLADALSGAVGENGTVRRLAGLSLPGADAPQAGGPARVLVVELPDDADVGPVLRALGGWSMTHPSVTLTIKADGPAGGVNLKLEKFSTVAFAAAAERILSLLSDEPADEA